MHVLEGGARFLARAHPHLPLAVVAQARGLQDAGQEVVGDAIDVGFGSDHLVRRRQHVRGRRALGEEFLFGDAVLGNRHAGGGGRDEAARGQLRQALRRDVFEFGGHGLAQAGQLVQRHRVVVAGGKQVIGGVPGRAVARRFQHGHLEAHGLRGMHEHAAELAAAHHAQPGRRRGGRHE